MDRALALLSDRLASEITRHTDALLDGSVTPAEWRERMARSIITHQATSFMLGNDTKKLTLADQRIIADANKFQLGFLDNFVDQIEAGEYDGLDKQLRARAMLYAGAAKLPYEQGRTRGVPLPYYPTETICRSNCGCSWQVIKLEGDQNWDATWVKGRNDSCATCVERQGRNPHQIRGGILQ